MVRSQCVTYVHGRCKDFHYILECIHPLKRAAHICTTLNKLGFTSERKIEVSAQPIKIGQEKNSRQNSDQNSQTGSQIAAHHRN